MVIFPAKLLRPGMIVREPECGCEYRVIAPESKAAIKEFEEVCPYPLLKYLSVGEHCRHVDRLYGERLPTAHGGRAVGRIHPDWDALETIRGGISDADIEASCLQESELARNHQLMISRLGRRIDLYLEFRPFRIPDMLPFLEPFPNGFWPILIHLRMRLGRMNGKSEFQCLYEEVVRP